MTKLEPPQLTDLPSLDPEMDRLLYISRIIRTLVDRAHTLLESHEFGRSLAAIAALEEAFNREMEVSLLRAYDHSYPHILS